MSQRGGRREEPRLFVLNDPTAIPYNPSLAKELGGILESMILQQIEYLIHWFGKLHDERRWIYLSIHDLTERYFASESEPTVRRAVERLIDRGLLDVGNYNQHAYDRTRWYTINLEGVSKLQSARLVQVETGSAQNDTRAIDRISIPVVQDDKSIRQNEEWTGQNEQCSRQTDESSGQNDGCIRHSDGTIPENLIENPSEIPTENTGERESPASSEAAEGQEPSLSPDASQPSRAREHPGVRSLREMTGRPVRPVAAAEIARVVPRQGPMLRWFRTCVRLWILHGYKTDNVDGVLDWTQHPDKALAQSHDIELAPDERRALQAIQAKSYVAGRYAGHVMH